MPLPLLGLAGAALLGGTFGASNAMKKSPSTFKSSGQRDTGYMSSTDWANKYKATQPIKPASVDTSMRDALNAQTQAIYAQIAAAPKLPSFDILGNYNKAKTTAEQNQRAYYDKLWNEKIGQWNAQTNTKRSQRDLGLETNAMGQRYTKEDNQTNRVRTGEDVAAAIDQINRGETNFQTDEGTQFDVDRRAAQEAMAGAGLATSGIGANQVGTQQDQRNIMSERQVQEFEVQRGAKELFKNRTFEDLARGDLRADEKKVIEDKTVNLDFDNYLAELAAEQQVARTGWEADYLGSVANETSRLNREGITNFINGLAGSGARAQDIEFAARVYGAGM